MNKMRFMHFLTIIVVLGTIVLSTNCNTTIGIKHEYTGLDSIWLRFAKAMELKDIQFLINNSTDSITCYDCKIGSNSDKIYFNSSFIFKNYIDKIMHLPKLSDKPFSTYQVNSDIIKITYNINSSKAPEGAYDLVFTLVKKDEKYLFEGMMVQ